MAPKRVALNKIKSLTFESGVQTEARRTDPIRKSSPVKTYGHRRLSYELKIGVVIGLI